MRHRIISHPPTITPFPQKKTLVSCFFISGALLVGAVSGSLWQSVQARRPMFTLRLAPFCIFSAFFVILIVSSSVWYQQFSGVVLFFYEYIRTFVRVKFVYTNKFVHSCVSVLQCNN